MPIFGLNVIIVIITVTLSFVRLQVINGKLAELDSLIHHLLSIEEQLASATPPDKSIVPSLSLLTTKLTQVVWPAMAVIGGLDSGFCLGSPCRLEGGKEAVIVSIPDSELNVVVEEKVTDTTGTGKKRYAYGKGSS